MTFPYNEKEKVNKKFTKVYWLGLIFFVLLCGYFTSLGKVTKMSGGHQCGMEKHNNCPIPSKLPIQEREMVQYILHDDDFRLKSADYLSKAVQIDTIVFDEMKDYSKMSKFHEYLEANFPLVYKTAQVHKINDYGLVFEFKGQNSDLKPILLLAHQDTVPVGDINDWNESPLSGRYDGEKIFGRGASDCKSLLVSLMRASEMVIEQGNSKFDRGFILAFGFDEEKSGFDGAKHIGEWLVEQYGENSIDHVIDEGSMMFMDYFGDHYSFIATGEKGYIDLSVEVYTPGGHSSVPRDHTSIGIISKFLVAYEEDTFSFLLDKSNPMLGTFECMAEHGRLPLPISRAAKHARTDPKANQKVVDYIAKQPGFKSLIVTTQAIDIIEGGDKANALPRAVKAVINHRINYGNDEETIWSKASKHGNWIALKYGLGLEVNNETLIEATENGKIVISALKDPLRPAKATPLYDNIYNNLTGTIKAFYEDEVFPEKFENMEADDPKLIIAPALMTGNTDTRHYWKLTDHIFRVQPGSMDFFKANIHGPNEYVELDSHLQSVAFYYNYIITNA